MIKDIRVGIPAIGGKGWMGGVSHNELLIKAVVSLPPEQRPKLYLVVYDFENYEYYRGFADCFDGIITLGSEKKSAPLDLDVACHCNSEEDLSHAIDFYFPVSYSVLLNIPSASWIHDFQHHYMTEFFSPEEVIRRQTLCERVAQQAKLIYCSSHAVEKDFWKLYPNSQAQTRVLSMRVVPEESWFTGDPRAIGTKYGLPEAFILCCNQFWQHKNHHRLFTAIALLRQAGQDVHLVCTGETYDFRRPQYFAELQNYITELGITDLVHILGVIPREDQIQLIRRSLVVVQPSLFEGLSLIVQECRALGKTIVLSDLDVHLEHEYGTYFNGTSEQDLAAKIATLLPVSHPGPDFARETEARLQAPGLARAYAKSFCQLVEESQLIYQQCPQAPFIKLSPQTTGNITLGTSLNLCANMEDQRQVVESWLEAGFKVLSVNSGKESEILAPMFPEVLFRVPRREERSEVVVGACLDDIFAALADADSDICGIIDSGTRIIGRGLHDFIGREAHDSLVFGDRVDIEGLVPYARSPFPQLGYFFFNKALTGIYPQEKFRLGLPWWDAWMTFPPLAKKMPLKQIVTPIAYHVIQPCNYPDDLWVSYGQAFARHLNPTYSLTLDTITKFRCVFSNILTEHSSTITVNSCRT